MRTSSNAGAGINSAKHDSAMVLQADYINIVRSELSRSGLHVYYIKRLSWHEILSLTWPSYLLISKYLKIGCNHIDINHLIIEAITSGIVSLAQTNAMSKAELSATIRRMDQAHIFSKGLISDLSGIYDKFHEFSRMEQYVIEHISCYF